MESGRPPRWRLAVFVAALAVAAGAFGALGLPQLAVVAEPQEWRLAAAKPAVTQVKPRRCRHEHPLVRPFDNAR